MRKIGNRTIERLLDILQFQLTFLICTVIVGILINFVIFPVYVSGNSMYPTLHNQDFGVSSILTKNLEEIERFDVVIVKVDNEYWVKRVIGLPNETISCVDGQVFVNGNPLEESFVDEIYMNDEIKEHGYFNSDFSEIVLGNDEVFLMGDNRVHSMDSRIVGPFKLSSIKAKDMYILWPFENGKVVK